MSNNHLVFASYTFADLPCKWTQSTDWEMAGAFFTACGDAMYFTDDGPVENNFIWCPFCGHRIEIIFYVPEETEND